MSADDFQSKYASVMESMLKRAIAETTKLFENMVDELKAEISVIKKENEDLKTKCIQYESAKNKPEAQPGDGPPIAEPPDASEKCDTAIQCDLVPCRTILVEECEPIIHKELESQSQHSYGLNHHSLQEHNYVSYRDRTSPMEYVVLKKEPELKQEDDDCEVACGQVLGTFGASAGEAEIGGPYITDCSIEQIKVLKKSTQLVLQLPCSETEKAQLAQNQSTDLKLPLAISPEDGLRDDIKEESEMVEVAKHVLLGSKRRVPSTCHLDSATTHNEKTALNSKPVSTQKAGEELNSTVQEGKAISKPNASLGRRRGRPPKKSRQKQALPPSFDEGPKHHPDTKAPPPGKELTEPSLALVTEASSGINSSTQKGVKTVLEDNNVEFQSLSSSFSSVEQPTLEVQECCPEMEMDAAAEADKTPDSSSCVQPEASTGLVKATQTSVSLQDALLLVEAMNQSTMESNVPSLRVSSQPQIESSSASSLGSLKSVSEIPTVQHMTPVETQTVSAETSPISAKSKATSSSKDTKLKQVVVMLQQVPPLSCAASPTPLSSTAATQTVIQSLPLPLISKPAPNKRPRTIIILPRSSPTSDNAKNGSQTKRSSVNSATLNKSNLPHSSAGAEAALRPEAPVPSPVPSKTIKIVYKKPDPVLPLESSTILTDHQHVAPKTITIVSKKMPSGVPRKTEHVVLAVKDNNEPVPSVAPKSTHLISELQASGSSYSDHTLDQKTNNAADNLDSPGKFIPVAESMIAPTQEHSGSEFPADPIQPQVSSSLSQTTEPKLHAVVRLTRLPFSISTKESVLISTLISKGVIQGESLSAYGREQAPVDFYPHSPGPSPVDEPTSHFKQDILSSDMEYKEEEEDATTKQNVTSHPQDLLSNTLFLAKPSASPLENEPTINEHSNAKGAKSIVSRLRSHLQAHLKAKRGSIKHLAANDSTPTSSKLNPLSPKRLTKLNFSPEKIKSIADEKGSDLEMSGIPSCSTSPKSKPKTKPMKRKSSSFSHRSSSLTAGGPISETTESEHEVPSPKHLKLAKNHTSPQMDEEYTPQKPRRIKGNRGRKSNHKVANNKKLTSAAKCSSRVGKKRGKYKKRKLVLPVIESGIKKKWHAKVWYPPTLPPNEKPMTDIIRPPPLKVEYRIPDIPLSAPAIVSPLQPLAVIGRHLLRNQCGECGRVFSNSNALESHVSLHKIYRPFSCKLCGKYFPDAKTFKRHDRVHRNGRIHVCQQCGRGFVYRFSLGKHIQMVHSRIRPFICQVCGNGFYTKRDVEIHIRIHTGEKPFQCHICERRFTRKVELNVHLRWHNGEKRHWCQYCGKGFLDYNNLKRHRYTHTGEKPCSCPHCPKSFTQTGHLKKHITTVHKDVIGID